MRLNPARIELVTFDCFGTLVDWESGILSAMHPLLTHHGVHAGVDEILQAFGRAESAIQAGPYLPYREVLRRTLTGMARDLGFAPRATELDALAEGMPGWQPFPEVGAALTALAGRYRLGLISNVDDDLLAPTLGRLPVSFDPVVTSQSVGAYKPAPEPFEAVLARASGILAGDRSRWLHVGCSLFHDVSPARALGIPSVHVVRNTGRAPCTPPVPGRNPADAHVGDLAGLWRWLGEGAA